jgi:hypothetical protein
MTPKTDRKTRIFCGYDGSNRKSQRCIASAVNNSHMRAKNMKNQRESANK